MIMLPALIPVTTPVVASTVALRVLLLLHVPPVLGWVSVVVSPTHTLGVPAMAANVLFTVTTVVLKQPVRRR
jgi:hypothetical protein